MFVLLSRCQREVSGRNSGVVIRDVGVDDQAREFGGNLVRSIGDETRPPKTSTT
jgi:hypothetical protein